MQAKTPNNMERKNRPTETESAPERDSETIPKSERRFTAFQFAGIVLVAAVVFNLPNVVIPPTTTEERMMIVVLAAMLIAGAMLLGLPTLLERMRKKKREDS